MQHEASSPWSQQNQVNTGLSAAQASAQADGATAVLFPGERRGQETGWEKKNPLDTSPSDTDISTLESLRLAGTNPFHRAPTQADHLLPTDSPVKDHLFTRPEVQGTLASPAIEGTLFSSSDSFQDFTSVDPFDSPLSKRDDDFKRFSNGAPDIFQPLPLKPDFFETPRSSASSTLPHSTPSSRLSPDPTAGATWSSPGFLEEHQSLTPTTSQTLAEKPEVVLTTPAGTKQNLLQPTPFTRARNLRMSSSQTPPVMTHVCIWIRFICL